MIFSDEQELFMQTVLAGHNVLVDACIGSGKTTAIQELCNRFPVGHQVLYLTYNKLLKIDAKKKISRAGTFVTNYHGFAWGELNYAGIPSGVGDLIQNYLRYKPQPPHFDVLILDEYQDIEEEISEMLLWVKQNNPDMQIVAVGDMEQKIYDKTRLDAADFIKSFLGKDRIELEFTQCFRLSDGLAGILGEVWHKRIFGVNPSCEVRKCTFDEAFDILCGAQPSEVLVLGSNKAGLRSMMQNKLEEECGWKYNRDTLWSRIKDGEGGATNPREDCAVFTTFDGCKGMERDICVVCDWTESYWNTRLSMPDARYAIIRNIFCVAASRGKKQILFVEPLKDSHHRAEPMLSVESLLKDRQQKRVYFPVGISAMFDFKFIEDVEKAYHLLDAKCLRSGGSVIDAPTSCGYIDLSFCVGIYQEMIYFRNSSIDKAIESVLARLEDEGREDYEDWDLSRKILYLARLETGQTRYLNQVSLPLVSDDIKNKIIDRLSLEYPQDAQVQRPCSITFSSFSGRGLFTADGLIDVWHMDDDNNEVPVELKFVSELSHTHFLQCACYVAATGAPYGILWNVRDDSVWEVRIPDRWSFMDAVACAVTKGDVKRYSGNLMARLGPRKPGTRVRPKAILRKDLSDNPMHVIDVGRRPAPERRKLKKSEQD